MLLSENWSVFVGGAEVQRTQEPHPEQELNPGLHQVRDLKPKVRQMIGRQANK